MVDAEVVVSELRSKKTTHFQCDSSGVLKTNKKRYCTCAFITEADNAVAPQLRTVAQA